MRNISINLGVKLISAMCIGIMLTSCGKNEDQFANSVEVVWHKKVVLECNDHYVPPVGSPSKYSITTNFNFDQMFYHKSRIGTIKEKFFIDKNGEQSSPNYRLDEVKRDVETDKYYYFDNADLYALDGGVGEPGNFIRTTDRSHYQSHIANGSLFYLLEDGSRNVLVSESIIEGSQVEELKIDLKEDQHAVIRGAYKVAGDILVLISLIEWDVNDSNFELIAYSVNDEKQLWRRLIEESSSFIHNTMSRIVLVDQYGDANVLDPLTGEVLFSLDHSLSNVTETAQDGDKFFYNSLESKTIGVDLVSERVFFKKEMKFLAAADQKIYGLDDNEKLHVYDYNENRKAKINLYDIEEGADLLSWRMTHGGKRLMRRNLGGCESTTIILYNLGI